MNEEKHVLCEIKSLHKDTNHNEYLHENNLQKCGRNTCNSCLLWSSITAIAIVTLSAAFILWVHEKDNETLTTPRGKSYSTIQSDSDSARGALVCYYNLPGVEDTKALLPRDIHPHLCTHINIAFAQVKNKTIYLDQSQLQALPDVIKLKANNPNLKILLSIGGAGDSDGFSEMIVDHASRKTFIRSIKYFLRNYTLDGVDLDWEFPAIHKSLTKKRERQHFSQLLREIRTEYIREKRNYLLTVAVAAPQTIVDISYDVDQLDLYVDFVNIMTYDFHYYTKYTPFTGLNSPLYARSSEQLYMATLNINYTVNMYIGKGLRKDKIVVGIPTYGHTFTLVNSNNAAIGSPASGFGSIGSQGFINYPDICLFQKNYKDKVVTKYDDSAKVPYLYKDQEWVSYDSPQSVMEKATFIKKTGLRGAMIYSLNSDDYTGQCQEQVGDDVKFPLAHAVKITLTQAQAKHNPR